MHSTDQKKVMKDGYKILRSADYPSPRINILTDKMSWMCWQTYESKAARDREVKRIINSESKMIFD